MTLPSSLNSSWQQAVVLDDKGCLSLDKILQVFSAPITEVHAWAILHQTLSCLSDLLDRHQSQDHDALFTISHPQDIIIHSDGEVHVETFKQRRNERKTITSENVAVSDVGVAIYDALDYGVSKEEQRTLSEELEDMIDEMISSDGNEDVEEGEDEGLGEEVDITRTGLLKDILEKSKSHLAVSSDADNHFQGVCRALVAEALEISFFMTRIQNEDNSEMEEVEMKKWTSAWSQIMNQLRHGIKLKHVEYSKTPSEFSLTPYEMLMDDIRSAKVKLSPVEARPRPVSSDTRDKILEFIRSRPPLRPASQRVLGPKRRKESTVRELIMEDIRGKHSLRRIERKPSKNNVLEDLRRRRRVGVIAEESPVKSDDSPVLSGPDSSTIISRRRGSRRDTGKHRRTMSSKKSATSLSFLNLTVSEVSKKRSDLARRAMEDKNLPSGLYSDLMEGRTCFVCLKVNFGLTHWSYTCLLCLKFVCRHCCLFLKIPSEADPDKVTVSSIMPQLCSEAPVSQPSPSPSHLIREGFHRLSMRSRFPLVRSNTMGKEEEDKVKRLNLAQRNAPMPPPGTSSRYKLTRANTTLDGSQSPASLLKTSRSKVVCSSCRDVLGDKMKEMKRGNSKEHRKSLIF